MTRTTQASYLLDREELLKIRDRKLLTSVRDYLFFALQIDVADKFNPVVDVEAFCDRWQMSVGDFYKAVGELKNKGVVLSLSTQLNLQIQPPQ